MDKCREAFEKKFPIPAHWIEFDEKRNKYYCPYVADAKASEYQEMWEVWQSRQAEVDQLKEVLDERTKEWLEAIKLGTYFQDAAKPLKDEVDQLQSQINEMAEVGLSQESAIREKDKRIESALYVLKGLKAENDLWGCAQVNSQIDLIETALQGKS